MSNGFYNITIVAKKNKLKKTKRKNKNKSKKKSLPCGLLSLGKIVIKAVEFR
jgi:hypothetical protein